MKIVKLFPSTTLLVLGGVPSAHAREDDLDIEKLVRENARYERMIERLEKRLERIQNRKDRNGNTSKWLETAAQLIERSVDDNKKKKYRDWKDEAERAVKASRGVKIHVGKDLNPCLLAHFDVEPSVAAQGPNDKLETAAEYIEAEEEVEDTEAAEEEANDDAEVP